MRPHLTTQKFFIEFLKILECLNVPHATGVSDTPVVLCFLLSGGQSPHDVIIGEVCMKYDGAIGIRSICSAR